jgi:hypothetical protein
MEVVSRERKRTQTTRKGKHDYIVKTTNQDDDYQAITTKGMAQEKTSSPAAPILAKYLSL